MPRPDWREDPDNDQLPDPRYWCSILSTEGHKHCDKPYFCGCPCHLVGDTKDGAKWRKGRKVVRVGAWVAGVRY